MFHLVATRLANDSPAAIAEIDHFVKRLKLADEIGYESPNRMYTTLHEIPQYGWPATCPECKYICCVTNVQKKKPDRLIPPLCNNTKAHKSGMPISLKADNLVVRPYVKHV